MSQQPTMFQGSDPYLFDFLVVGGGIAGLTFALEAAKHGTVAVLFKTEVAISSTAWAQGGIAAVQDDDDTPRLHAEDTLRTGCGLSHEAIVTIVVTEGPDRIKDLVTRGVRFDKDSDGERFHLHREGGHSRRRIFHTADATGRAIHEALLARAAHEPQITFFTNSFAIDLITTRHLGNSSGGPAKTLGAYVLLPDKTVARFLAKKTLVATGGAGKVYLYTSNPDIATGDGIAMCFRAGARVGNMEFFQFHPTCLYHPDAKSFLITEAMRGEGAKLMRKDGERFMPQYHSDEELAPRDVVARAIDSELKRTGDDFVHLSMAHRDPDFIKTHFPTIYQRCLEFGIDITRDPIPVVPAAHFCCGGVVTDEFGKTDIENLYVAGETAHTGLHGANRLASNSLLEGVVFGYRAAQHACSTIDQSEDPAVLAPLISPWDTGAAVASDEEVIISQNWDEIRQFMWNYVGIVRSEKRLARALRRSELIEQEIDDYYWNFHVTPDLLELRNLSVVANLVIRSAMNRKESRGLHYTIDYPVTSEDECHDTIIALPVGGTTSSKGFL